MTSSSSSLEDDLAELDVRLDGAARALPAAGAKAEEEAPAAVSGAGTAEETAFTEAAATIRRLVDGFVAMLIRLDAATAELDRKREGTAFRRRLDRVSGGLRDLWPDRGKGRARARGVDEVRLVTISGELAARYRRARDLFSTNLALAERRAEEASRHSADRSARIADSEGQLGRLEQMIGRHERRPAAKTGKAPTDEREELAARITTLQAQRADLAEGIADLEAKSAAWRRLVGELVQAAGAMRLIGAKLTADLERRVILADPGAGDPGAGDAGRPGDPGEDAAVSELLDLRRKGVLTMSLAMRHKQQADAGFEKLLDPTGGGEGGKSASD